MDSCCCRVLWSMVPGVAVVLERLLAMRGVRRRPVALVGGVAVTVGSTVLCPLTGGASKVLLTAVLFLIKGRTSSEGRPMLAEGPAEEELRRVGSTVAGAVSGMSA